MGGILFVRAEEKKRLFVVCVFHPLKLLFAPFHHPECGYNNNNKGAF